MYMFSARSLAMNKSSKILTEEYTIRYDKLKQHI
jgi:hypothetical protein